MTRVFIYGGCVSRDAVRYYSPYGMSLVGYVSRQSLPSALAPARLRDFTIPGSLPNFQQRMIRGDIQSSLPNILSKRASEIDLLLWDLNIERAGFYRLRTGEIVTRSEAQIISESFIEGAYPFGTREHLELWKNSLCDFVSLLCDTGLFGKTIVNATPWAALPTSDKGDPQTGLEPKTFNTAIQEYWNHAEKSGIKIARVPSEKVIADPEHKWGPAYFHYKPRTYKTQVKSIAQIKGLRPEFRIPTRQEILNIFDPHV